MVAYVAYCLPMVDVRANGHILDGGHTDTAKCIATTTIFRHVELWKMPLASWLLNGGSSAALLICNTANTVNFLKACVTLHNFLVCTDTANSGTS